MLENAGHCMSSLTALFRLLWNTMQKWNFRWKSRQPRPLGLCFLTARAPSAGIQAKVSFPLGCWCCNYQDHCLVSWNSLSSFSSTRVAISSDFTVFERQLQSFSLFRRHAFNWDFFISSICFSNSWNHSHNATPNKICSKRISIFCCGMPRCSHEKTWVDNRHKPWQSWKGY